VAEGTGEGLSTILIVKLKTMETSTVTQSQSILEDAEYQLVQASSGKRLANLIIDRLLFVAFLFGFAFVLELMNANFFIYFDSTDIGIRILDQIFTTVFFAVFVFLFEVITKGKTIGKFITGTRAVKQNGNTITPKDALMRALSRMVPFEAFSALGSPCYPWHDKWTDTHVIDEKLSHYQK
jgi:uncharacterized RDD family membrane protein YckC